MELEDLIFQMEVFMKGIGKWIKCTERAFCTTLMAKKHMKGNGMKINLMILGIYIIINKNLWKNSIIMTLVNLKIAGWSMKENLA